MNEIEYRCVERWLNAALEVFRSNRDGVSPYDAEIRDDIRKVLEKVVAQKLRIESKTSPALGRPKFSPGVN